MNCTGDLIFNLDSLECVKVTECYNSSKFFNTTLDNSTNTTSDNSTNKIFLDLQKYNLTQTARLYNETLV